MNYGTVVVVVVVVDIITVLPQVTTEVKNNDHRDDFY